MARPSKDTVDYFPHYVSHGKTIFTLEAMYGNDGYAAWFKILEVLGETPGHCFDTNDQSNWIYFLAKLKVDETIARNILKTLCDLRAIDAELYENGMIWSDNFLAGLRRVYEKRSTEMPNKPSFRAGNCGEGALPAPQVPKTPQSKVKKSKEEKVEKKKHGTFDNVYLSEKEYLSLSERFGDEVEEKINALSEYVSSKGKKYTSHYATILSWARKDGEKPTPKKPAGGPRGTFGFGGVNKVLL